MKHSSFIFGAVAILSAIVLFRCSAPVEKEIISFYAVPLVCGADSNIGCGSRIKPLFVQTAAEKKIAGSWTNRQGTVIAIVWDPSMKVDAEKEKIILPLFEKNKIEAKLISDTGQTNKLLQNFSEKKNWYKGMDVDKLSIEEAGFIAQSHVDMAKKNGLINDLEASSLKKVIEDYFKKELVKIRTYDDLVSDKTRQGWMNDIADLSSKFLSREKIEKIEELYYEQQECNTESCCDKKKGSCCKKAPIADLETEMTCPKCGFKKMVTMPTDVCVLKYTCEKCKAEMFPKKGDCCVYCTYGTKKCPSMQ